MSVPEVSLTRLRWRMKGAWMWPTFFVVTAAEAVLLHLLPFAGDKGLDLFGSALIAGFFNLFTVAVVAPLIGLLVRRRRRGLPQEVARDYAGTTLLVGVAALLLTAGLLHRPQIIAERQDRAAAVVAVHDYVVAQIPKGGVYRQNVGAVNLFATDEDDLYRGCVPGDRPNRSLCLYVDTSTDPAGVTRDPSKGDNATLFSPSAR